MGKPKDSDAILSTNDPLLLKTAPRLPVIVCQQRSGTTKRVEWDDFITSNIAAAGDDIGAITNRVTGMYDLLTMVETDEQRAALMYRIQCGQHFQQNAID